MYPGYAIFTTLLTGVNELSFLNWNNGEPSKYNNIGESENCVLMNYGNAYKGKWNDASCSQIHHYVCELAGKIFYLYPHWRRFLTGSKLLYQIWPPKWFFKQWASYIILKSRNLEICKHSSFFNYCRNSRLNQTWSSDI